MSDARRAWLYAHAQDEDGPCISWPFSLTKTGRGTVRLPKNGKKMAAATAMCAIAHGPAPTSAHQAAHSCGNGAGGCMHPKHVRWATREENDIDRANMDGAQRGEKCGTAVLDRTQVLEIRALAGKMSQGNIAKKYGISLVQAHRIIHRERWSWLSDVPLTKAQKIAGTP